MDNLAHLTVDAVVTRDDHVLLVQRGQPPFEEMWALPGGHVHTDERLKDAAAREVQEETGITVNVHDLVGVYDAPDRDPRGRVVSCAFHATPTTGDALEAGSDAADARWVPVDDLPGTLAFDHSTILDDYTRSRAAGNV